MTDQPQDPTPAQPEQPALPAGVEIVRARVEDFQQDPRNANQGTELGQNLLEESLTQLGAGRSVLLDKNGYLIAGNKTTRTAGDIGMQDAIIVRTDGKTLVAVQRTDLDLSTDPRATRLALLDNRVAEMDLKWDPDVLKQINDEQPEVLAGLWDAKSLRKILAGATGGNGSTETDAGAELELAEQLQLKWGTAPGQIWQLGEHRLAIGDCTDAALFAQLMMGQKAQLCWTDPPWNVAYGETDHPSWRARTIINDNLGERFPEFIQNFCKVIKDNTHPCALLYMAMSAQEWPNIDVGLRTVGFHWSSTIIWVKDHAVLSRKDYHTRFEPIWYGWNDEGPRLVPLADRTQNDVWEIDRPTRSEEHPTMKPVELVQRAVQNSSLRGDLVIDPFLGSGTTMIACELADRVCYGTEMHPPFGAVILERWHKTTGRQPELVPFETPA